MAHNNHRAKLLNKFRDAEVRILQFIEQAPGFDGDTKLAREIAEKMADLLEVISDTQDRERH